MSSAAICLISKLMVVPKNTCFKAKLDNISIIAVFPGIFAKIVALHDF